MVNGPTFFSPIFSFAPRQSLLMCARTPHKCDIPSRSLGQAKAVRHAIAENIPLFSLELLVCSKNLQMHTNVHRQRRQCFLNASKGGRNKRQLLEESSAKQVAALLSDNDTHTCSCKAEESGKKKTRSFTSNKNAKPPSSEVHVLTSPQRTT